MASCITPSPETIVFNKEIVDLDIVTKYNELSAASKADGSLLLYMKDTIETIFKDYEISTEEKGKIISQTIGQMVLTTNQTAMQLAVQWSITEEQQSYELAKLKNDAIRSEMELYKAYTESCLVNANINLTNAQTDKTVADMIMEDGHILSRDANGVVATLDGSGVKASQILQIDADTYATQADSFRKSGVVQVGTDLGDSIVKGLTGDNDGTSYASKLVTLRQEKGFDDNMRQHAANSASQMISFQLSGDAADAIQAADVQRWRDAIDYLLT